MIRNRQLAPLLLNLLLASYQKQLGGELGVVPGSELLAAAQLAEALGIPVRAVRSRRAHHPAPRLGRAVAVAQGAS